MCVNMLIAFQSSYLLGRVWMSLILWNVLILQWRIASKSWYSVAHLLLRLMHTNSFCYDGVLPRLSTIFKNFTCRRSSTIDQFVLSQHVKANMWKNMV
jgi:hypothetical protein